MKRFVALLLLLMLLAAWKQAGDTFPEYYFLYQTRDFVKWTAIINLGYACLYSGYYDDCDQLLTWAAGLGEGIAEAIRLDLEAQEAAGLSSEHTEALLSLLP